MHPTLKEPCPSPDKRTIPEFVKSFGARRWAWSRHSSFNYWPLLAFVTEAEQLVLSWRERYEVSYDPHSNRKSIDHVYSPGQS